MEYPALPHEFDELNDLYQAYNIARSLHIDDRNSFNLANLQKAAWKFGVYPSQSQLLEVHYTTDKVTNDTNEQISFHEFSVLVCSILYQLHKKNVSHNVKPPKPMRSISQSDWNVFLGGACNPTTWRRDTAIPFLKQNNMTFYNPQVATWSPILIEMEEMAKAASQVLLFVLDKRTRGIAGMVEVAYLAGLRRNIVLVMPECDQWNNCDVDGEQLTPPEIEALQQSYHFLRDLMERHGYPIFTDIMTALECVKMLVLTGTDIRAMNESEGAIPVKHGDINVAKCMTTLYDQFQSLALDDCDTLTHRDASIGLRVLLGMNFSLKTNPADHEREYSFSDFCLLYCREVRKLIKHNESFDLKAVSSYNYYHPTTTTYHKTASSPALMNNYPEINNNCIIVNNKIPHDGAHDHDDKDDDKLVPISATDLLLTLPYNVPFLGYVWKPVYQFLTLLWNTFVSQEMPQKSMTLNPHRKTIVVKKKTKTITTTTTKMDDYAKYPALASSSCIPEFVHEIYLGGLSALDSEYRNNFVIPKLLRNGLNFYYPNGLNKQKRWTDRILPSDAWHREHSKLLFYILTKDNIATGSLVECAFYIGCGRQIVLHVETLENNHNNNNNEDDSSSSSTEQQQVNYKLSDKAVNDYNRGRRYLISLANVAGVAVMDTIDAAMNRVVDFFQCPS